MSLSFSNTEIAFRSKNDSALRRSFWLFKTIEHPWMVKIGTTLLRICLWLRLPIDALIKRTIFQQFCGGETIGECRETIDSLWRYHIGTILDYSVEGSQKDADFERTAHEIQRTIEIAAGNPSIPFCVFKVTGIARFNLLAKLNSGLLLGESERSEWQRVRQRMQAICGLAHDKNVRIFVDAEESWVQDTIDRLTLEMMSRFNKQTAIVFNTLQMYRRDRLDFLKKCHRNAITGGYFLGVKLVRGAYMEKERARAQAHGLECPILPQKTATDQNYDASLAFCVENIDRIAICAGTHNEASTLFLTELMAKHHIEHRDERVFFSQLLGMSDHLSYNLANDGYNVAKYVPYGPVRSVIPYLIRRAEENTSIKGQTSRELGLIVEERQRRKTLQLASGARTNISQSPPV